MNMLTSTTCDYLRDFLNATVMFNHCNIKSLKHFHKTIRIGLNEFKDKRKTQDLLAA